MREAGKGGGECLPVAVCCPREHLAHREHVAYVIRFGVQLRSARQVSHRLGVVLLVRVRRAAAEDGLHVLWVEDEHLVVSSK